jgi:hypothetical protein
LGLDRFLCVLEDFPKESAKQFALFSFHSFLLIKSPGEIDSEKLIRKPSIIPILNEVEKLSQGGFLRELPTENT